MTSHPGGCLCGAIRFETRVAPVRVSFCHCRFCQRATGGPYIVEPIFNSTDVVTLSGAPKRYSHTSAGSGQDIHLHFCDTCGSRLFYTFDRFEGMTGVLAGVFDDPNWFTWTAETAKHIFLDDARDDTVFPTGLPIFHQHATDRDGQPNTPLMLDRPMAARDLR